MIGVGHRRFGVQWSVADVALRHPERGKLSFRGSEPLCNNSLPDCLPGIPGYAGFYPSFAISAIHWPSSSTMRSIHRTSFARSSSITPSLRDCCWYLSRNVAKTLSGSLAPSFRLQRRSTRPCEHSLRPCQQRRTAKAIINVWRRSTSRIAKNQAMNPPVRPNTRI